MQLRRDLSLMRANEISQASLFRTAMQKLLLVFHRFVEAVADATVSLNRGI